MRAFITLLALFIVQLGAFSQTAQLQIIHNSPSPTVDIWVNDQPFLTNVDYRTATPYLEVPAGTQLEVGVAPSPSTDTSDIIARFPVTLNENSTNVAIATGIVGDTVSPFTLALNTMARDTAVSDNFEFFAFHGSTDAPAVDVIARDVATLVDDASYGDITPYIEVPADNYVLDVTPANDNDIIVASFEADLSGLAGQSAVVFASGFLSPPDPNAPAFGLFAALADGTVVALPQVENTAQLQIIHNSPSPTVDIWVNDAPFVTEVEYRSATPYVEVPAGASLEIGVAPSPSNDTSDIIARFPVVLEPNSTNVAIATGIVGDTLTPFNIALNTTARDSSESGLFEFIAYHGATDAPPVDVIARDVATIADSLTYGDFTSYIAVPEGTYTLDVTPEGNNDIIVASFEADLNGLDSQTAVVFASGFLNPSDTTDPKFGLFAALQDGSVVQLPSVSNTAQLQIIHNSPSPTVDIWVNNEPFLTNFEYRTATPFVEVPAGQNINIGVAPSPSNDPSEIVADFDINFAPNSTNVAIASGIVGDMNTPFTLALNAMARDSALTDQFEFTAFHGATDAPAVDVIARDVATLADDLRYGDFTDYAAVPPAQYILDVTPARDNNIIVASFEANLTSLGGTSAVVFASGFVNPPQDGDPEFGLFAAFPNGLVAELPPVENTAQLQIIHNSPSPTVDIWVNNEPFLTNFEYRTATPYVEVPAGTNLDIGIAPSPSSDPSEIIANFPVNFEPESNNIAIATGIVGDPNTPFNLVLNTEARTEAQGNDLEFFVYHGSTDAPEVDVIARDVATLVDNIAYGDQSNYIEVPANNYILDITPADDNSTVVASFDANLSGLAGQSAVVYASGFLRPPMSNDPEFGLFAVLADGTTIPLEATTSVTDPALSEQSLSLFPVPARENLDVNFQLTDSRSIQLEVINMNGQEVLDTEVGRLGAGVYTEHLNINSLPTGSYFLRVISDQGVTYRLFNKQ